MPKPRSGLGHSSRGRNPNHTDRSRDVRNDFDSTGELNSHLAERFKGKRQKLPTPDTYNSDLDVSLNKDIRQYVHDHDKKVQAAEAGDWRGLPEIPTNDEVSMALDDEVTLIPNKIKGKWKTKEKYLKAHYELHREDAVSPLRDAVDKFRKDPGMNDDHTLNVYEKVHFSGFTFSQLGIAARIRLSTNRSGRHILWQSSSRLKSGTLIALTPADNNFESRCVIALVAARPLAAVQQNPPEIDLFFCRVEDIQIDPQQEWTMVEAKQGYYESYRHTLKALQKLSHEPFTLSSHICSLSRDIQPPAYLTNNSMVDLKPSSAEDGGVGYSTVDILNDWPDHSLSSLDASQWSALQHVLTKSLAIIQGPPGTGKTYCSKVALEILHGYLKDGDPPIIITAQTNHALDQLLEHISKFEPNYIRLGGRSTSLKVKERALYEVRQKERLPLIAGGLLGKATSNWTMQQKKMIELLTPMWERTKDPLSIEILAKHGIITQKQSESLGAGASRWVSSDGSKADPLHLWLDRALIPFKVDYHVDHFTMNEEGEDLEIEQLKEHEAEHGINDEEDAESLKGPWCFLQDNWTVPDPIETDMEKAAELLATHQDLWKVPEYIRGPMYKLMQQRFRASLLVKFKQLAAVYEQNLKDLKVGKWERDAVFLRRARIIGLTTTGLSKYRPLIASLKPKIVLIEEAAEVLEAPVTVACMESVEHLILVGDHQQLQGHCSVQELENEPYHLNVSLFERLVNNSIPFKTLLQQRRMDPTFRKLIQSLYPDLDDHYTVRDRPRIDWGMGKVNSFFFSHDWSEYKDAQMSTYNEEEARFIAGFYHHLIRNNVPSSSITILTFYNGQRKRLLKEIKAYHDLSDSYNIVKTVDSYQGEENDIVLLSLVRSNFEGNIGFLEISNRVCVALSRAKLGFYIFGNADLLARKNELWSGVVTMMLESQRLAQLQFPTFCERHQITEVLEVPDDWANFNGGCATPCELDLPCGHKCNLKCHPSPHDKVFCAQKCGRRLVCGDDCRGKCSEQCFCDCPRFAQAEKEMWEPTSGLGDGQLNGNGGTYHDVRREHLSRVTMPNPGQDGKYVSGQQGYHHEPRSAFYLPEQVPRLNEPNQPGMREDSNQLGVWENSNQPGMWEDNNQLGAMNHSHQSGMMGHSNQPGMLQESRKCTQPGSGYGSFPVPKSSPSKLQDREEVVQTCRMSPEDQAWSRTGWNKFAGEGVKKDDERRQDQWSDDIPGPDSQNRDWPSLTKAHKTRPMKEKTEQLGDGRSKFTHAYQPAANAASGKLYPEGKYGKH